LPLNPGARHASAASTREDVEHPGPRLHRQVGIDIAVADLIGLQYFSVLPHHGHRTGELAGIAGVTNGGLIALEKPTRRPDDRDVA
jgi:hypothetical protein